MIKAAIKTYNYKNLEKWHRSSDKCGMWFCVATLPTNTVYYQATFTFNYILFVWLVSIHRRTKQGETSG